MNILKTNFTAIKSSSTKYSILSFLPESKRILQIEYLEVDQINEYLFWCFCFGKNNDLESFLDKSSTRPSKDLASFAVIYNFYHWI